jgi:peptide/nickel transport system substrate-binding protein
MNRIDAWIAPHRPRRGRLFAVVIALLLLVSSCGGGTGQSGPRVLNIGQASAPNSLDPAKINQAFEWYINLAYDPLIFRSPQGLQPRLAESWGYVGTGNRVFELKLRPNVTFSDGSPLNAEVVKANIDYYRQAGGQSVPFLSPITSIETPDPRTVRLVLSEPNPMLADVFTQDYLAGNLISGQALRQPNTLATNTFGAGPYTLDAAQTVPGDHYTYLPNPSYWDKANVHYDKVTIKVIPNPNTALAALKTGQVDVIQGIQDTADAAKAAGLQVTSTPQVFVGLALADRAGTKLPPLRDIRVRQALNHAVDRDKLTRGLFREYGTVTEQVVLPGTDGYNDKRAYSYDPARARQLLTEAGYPNGFSVPVITTSFANQNLVVQAIADELQQVGIRLELTNEAEPSNYIKKLTSGEFPAYGIGYGRGPVHMMGPGLFLPTAPVFNPFKSSDPRIEQLYAQAAASDEAVRAELDRQIVARLVDQAWFVPVAFTPVFFFARSNVTGIEATVDAPIANPVSWRPAN